MYANTCQRDWEICFRASKLCCSEEKNKEQRTQKRVLRQLLQLDWLVIADWAYVSFCVVGFGFQIQYHFLIPH